MKNLLLTATLSLLAFAGMAQAHTHLKMTVPADNAVLPASPSELMLHFSAATRLTALSIQKDGEKEAKNIAPLPKQAADVLKIPLAAVSSGKYTVNWRVVGDDNHVMSGVLHFTVNAK